jgi:hypothetical protein
LILGVPDEISNHDLNDDDDNDNENKLDKTQELILQAHNDDTPATSSPHRLPSPLKALMVQPTLPKEKRVMHNYPKGEAVVVHHKLKEKLLLAEKWRSSR